MFSEKRQIREAKLNGRPAQILIVEFWKLKRMLFAIRLPFVRRRGRAYCHIINCFSDISGSIARREPAEISFFLYLQRSL